MYEELIHNEVRDGFECKLFIMPEDIHPRDCFDGFLIDEVINKIDRGLLTWVMAIMEVYKHGIELGNANLGGICERGYDEITDNYFDELAKDALEEAKENIIKITNL